MKKVDFEAHFMTKNCVKAMLENKGYPRYTEDEKGKSRRLWYTPEAGEPVGDVLLDKLLDLGEGRIKNMDMAGVDVQVLSLTAPGAEHFEPDTGTRLAREANDIASEAVKRYPDRFAAFAALAPKAPDSAAKELERAVKELGLKGWKTHANYGDTYLDDKKYWPILEKAEELDVPIYLHPTIPACPHLSTYGIAMAGAAFGFGWEAALAMMRLIFSGALDQFPRLRFMLGHLGEALPFVLQRIDFAYVRPWFDPDARPDLQRKPSDYLKQNVFMTTSGNYLQPAFMCVYEALGVDKILLATDYPYEDSEECLQFLDSLPISQEDKEKIYQENARQIGFVT